MTNFFSFHDKLFIHPRGDHKFNESPLGIILVSPQLKISRESRVSQVIECDETYTLHDPIYLSSKSAILTSAIPKTYLKFFVETYLLNPRFFNYQNVGCRCGIVKIPCILLLGSMLEYCPKYFKFVRLPEK